MSELRPPNQGIDQLKLDAFLADSVVKSGGKLHALGIGWDQLSAQSFPARHSRLSLGVVVTVPYLDTDSGHELRVRFQDADGNALAFGGRAPQPGETDKRPTMIKARLPQTRGDDPAPGDERTITLAINLDGLVFSGPGRYRFLLEIDGAPQKRLAFRVVQAAS
jgi:hypothetical protein